MREGNWRRRIQAKKYKTYKTLDSSGYTNGEGNLKTISQMAEVQ